jgi:hypothetical protein
LKQSLLLRLSGVVSRPFLLIGLAGDFDRFRNGGLTVLDNGGFRFLYDVFDGIDVLASGLAKVKVGACASRVWELRLTVYLPLPLCEGTS